MARWFARLTESVSTTPDTRKWTRNTSIPNAAGVSAVPASIVGGTVLDFSNTEPARSTLSGSSTTTQRAETMYLQASSVATGKWAGTFTLTAHVAGSDAGAEQSNGYVWLAHDGQPGATGQPSNGYALRIQPGNVNLIKMAGGAASALGGGAVTLDTSVGKSYDFVFEQTGSAIRFEVQPAGTAMTGTWTITAATDSAVPSGVPAISQWRFRPNKAGVQYKNLTFSSVGFRPTDAPNNFRDYGGKLIGFGRSRDVLKVGPLDAAQPSFLTGTVTKNNGRWTLAGTASGSSTLTFPAIPAGAFELVQLDIENFCVDSSGGVTWRLSLVGASATYEFVDADSFSSGQLKYGASSRDVRAFTVGTPSSGRDEGVMHKNLRLQLFPRMGKLQAGEGDSGVYGGAHMNGAVVTESLTPTLTITSGATARALSFSKFALTVESL